MTLLDELQGEMEATRRAFHSLLDEVPDEALDLPSDNPAWTVRQVLYHMSIAPRMLVADARLLTGNPRLYQPLLRLFPARLFHFLNERLTRRGARGLDRAGLRRAYDDAHAKALHALQSCAGGDFHRPVAYPDWDPLLAGNVDLERLFRYVRRHFEAHAPQVRAAVERGRQSGAVP